MKITSVKIGSLEYQLNDWELFNEDMESIYCALRKISGQPASYVGCYRTIGRTMFVTYRGVLQPLLELYCQMYNQHKNIGTPCAATPFTNNQVEEVQNHIDDFLRRANLVAFL